MHWPPTARDFARLRDTLAWVAERSPYYRRAFDAAGVRPADLHTYDDFRTRVPRTEKVDLADNEREMGLRLPYRIGFSTAEALTPALRQQLQAALGIELFDHIGEAQIGPVAGECRAHAGMHLHARDLFCEFLDPESGAPVGPSGVGELIATQLGHHALPLVRYAPRDAYRLLPGTCPCGNPAPHGQVPGRRR